MAAAPYRPCMDVVRELGNWQPVKNGAEDGMMAAAPYRPWAHGVQELAIGWNGAEDQEGVMAAALYRPWAGSFGKRG